MSASTSTSTSKYEYLTGFGNEHQSESEPGLLPVGQNNPQRCAKDLYCEQLSGTAFTVARVHNQRSWLYRVKPSVSQSKFSAAPQLNTNLVSDFSGNNEAITITPDQLRWNAFPVPKKTHHFVEGLFTICGAGNPAAKSGLAIYVFTCNTSMKDTSFYSADGEMLIVPQQGTLDIQTEFGFLEVSPGEIVVIPRGVNFAVSVTEESRGYVVEVYNGSFRLPDLGPIGANGLANPRDFQYPKAAYTDKECKQFTVINKFLGHLFTATRDHSIFNVAAWHGNYAPYKYDLSRFATVNSVSFDHMDPSIFTVLTCPSNSPGTAILDFVIFPGRWAVQEHTFRPPYFHRNCMSEYMGLIKGVYEAKKDGFVPGGGSLHSCMTPHGPDKKTFDQESTMELKPQRYPDSTLAFMFESSLLFSITKQSEVELQSNYHKVWDGF
mmetsp:Transcript_20740/g.30856  ORF Transcript_20740/g.30856 Transcript_20740/m.30856 type:complete len:436 (+) Transcript_20740:13-1320(+)|eukprot:CAMPEP_0201546612 /NCGR_PEP_ID=MMETSP0173_2-20130828/2899_1 /ASSEMBLY_ACC=CAM_ASM_000268 /TAXON_ID=218659 /ORGANISM="Vexillifera sp., Strain DIVA3 564/2" /LENGTH=435 /DNA_ID=CAMNT_0047955323 /DNA_START=13 /DNA_END=1320 /DNA_ORIENTATION=-